MSCFVINKKFNADLSFVGEITIGSNVFIGANSIILPGASIGDDVIIGAGCVVSGVIPNNGVYVGSGLKKLSTFDEFYKKKTNNDSI